jgi:DNA repair protein RecO (recombination protein O)
VVSGAPVQPEDQYFSYPEGGVVSRAEAEKHPALVPISMNALKLLRHLQRSAYDAISELRVPASVHQEVERLMQGYLTYLLERRLQSVDFIRRIRQ